MTFPVFDSHVDTLLALEHAEDLISGSPCTQLDIPRARAAGVRTLVTAICAEAAREMMPAFVTGMERFRTLSGRSDVEMLLMLEGCEPLEHVPDPSETIGMLSVASLTWNGENSFGGGIGSSAGLSDAGMALAVELHAAGVILDVSHLSDRSREDLLGSGLPVVATHCNCRALLDIPRNLPDEDMARIADLGGVTGITLVPDFLGEAANMDTIADHLEHAISVAGESHVGIGSDLDGTRMLPEGIIDCSFWPALGEHLIGRGWKEDTIRLVFDSNWRRVIPCGDTDLGG